VSSDVKTMTCCTSEKSIFRPPLGEIRVTKERISIPVVYGLAEGGWNLYPPLIYMPADSRAPFGRWAFCWKDRLEVRFARGDYHRYLSTGDYLLFREAARIIKDEWYYTIIITPLSIKNDDIQIKEEDAAIIGYYDERPLLHRFGGLPTQIIDYVYFRRSVDDPFHAISWRQYSPVEDDFLTRFLNRVRKYQERGMFYILL